MDRKICRLETEKCQIMKWFKVDFREYFFSYKLNDLICDGYFNQ